MTGSPQIESQHLRDLRASGIDESLAIETGIRSISHDEAYSFGFRYGGKLDGMFIPYWEPSAGRFSDRYARLKPTARNGDAKYLSPAGEAPHFYFAPGTTLADLLDPTVEIFLVEGEKKALSVLAWARRTGRRCIVIGIGGCNSWLRAIKGSLPDGSLGKVGSEPIPDFDLITWTGRRITICLDGDVVTNPAVKAAESGLARELLTRGGRVFVIRIPADQQGNRRGADDFIAQEGDAAWEAIVAAALPKSSGDTPISEILTEAGFDSLDDKAPLEAIELALSRIASMARGETPVRHSLLREGVVRALARAGVKSYAALADSALKLPVVADVVRDVQGRALVFNDPVPWPEPVDGIALLGELQSTLRKYLVLPPSADIAIPLWALHAHAHDAASTSPNLVMKSPTKRAGKTRTMSLVSGLVPRALPTSNITAASVFRTIEAFGPTLLVDEADSFLALNEELRGVLNSGHTRPTAVVVRTVGEEHVPSCFSTWCPKVIALIGHLPDTLEDRSIIIPMKRKAKHEKVARMRLSKIGKELEPLRSKIARWVKDNIELLRDAEPPLPEVLNDRAADNWEPLIAIADLCGGSWPEESRKAALALSGSDEEPETHKGIQLLGDVRDLFTEGRTDRLPSKQVVQALGAMEGRPWPEFRKGKPLSENQLAKMLKPFGVKPKTIRLQDATTPRGYLRPDLEDSFSRYLPPEVQHPQQLNDDGPSTRSADRNSDPGVAPQESGANPRQMALVAPVAPRAPAPAEAEPRNHATTEDEEEV